MKTKKTEKKEKRQYVKHGEETKNALVERVKNGEKCIVVAKDLGVNYGTARLWAVKAGVITKKEKKTEVTSEND